MADAPGPSSNSQLPACDECRKRKVRCDRRSPQCSNCERSKVQCLFTNEGKKMNTTRQLADDLAGLNSRLVVLGDTNAKLLERVDALAAEVSRSKRSSPVTRSPASPVHMDIQSPSDTAHQRARKITAGSNIVVYENGTERYFGPISTRSLFLQAKEQVVSYIQNCQQRLSWDNQHSMYGPLAQDHPPPSTRIVAILPELQRRVEFAGPLMALSNSDTSKGVEKRVMDAPVHLPPKGIVQTSVEIFFEESNLERIIFQKGIVIDAVEKCYQTNPEENEAWVVALNNIVVLSLCYRSKVIRNSQYILSDIDYDLLASRVEAASRALHWVERLSKPRVVNVQALLTLSLVARKFFSSETFESVFHRACQIAKDMGLPEGRSSENMSPTIQQERKNLIWALYAIDKQLTVTKDMPCHIYFFEINLPLPSAGGSADSSRQDSIPAQLGLAMLQEELYKRLNSPQARTQDVTKRQSTIYALNNELDAWWMQHETVLYRYEAHGSLSVSSLHLRYCFLSLKVLVHRSSEEKSSKQTTLRCAVEALKTLQQLCDGNSLIEGGLLAIDRLFRGCSILNFFELFENFLDMHQRNEDLDHLTLLIACTSALGLVSLPKYHDSYFVRMHNYLSWCTEIVQLIRDAENAQTMSVAGLDSTGQPGSCHPYMPYQGGTFQQYPGTNYGAEELSPVTHFTSSTSSGGSSGWTSSLNLSNVSTGLGNRVGNSDPFFSHTSTSSPVASGFGNAYSSNTSPVVTNTGTPATGGVPIATASEGGLNAMISGHMSQQDEQMTSSNTDYANMDFTMNPEFYDDLIKANAYSGQ